MQPLLKNDPKIVGRWKLLGRLGSGGMGVVYYGVDFEKKSSGNEVALKIIRDHILEDSSARSRLEREIDSLHAINSSYVAKIVEANIDGSPAWIATRRVNGPSLSKWVEDFGTMNMQQWLNLAHGLLSAINAIHGVGIIHRDIKPANILLEEQGEFLVPKMIDFGIAVDQESTSLTKTGMLVGTPAWLAPEQFLGEELTPSVDLFTVGSALLFAATGNNPWGLQDTSPIGSIIGAITSTTPNLESLNKDQKRLLSNILQKKPEKRISVSDALNLVNDIANENGISLLKLDRFDSQNSSTRNIKTRSTSQTKFSNSRNLLIAGLGVIALVVVGVVLSSSPTSAAVFLKLSTSEFQEGCIANGALAGLNETKVFIQQESSSEKVFLGQLTEGEILSPGSCQFKMDFGQFVDDGSNYNLEIFFPWDVYTENVTFKKESENSWIYELDLKLD